MKKIPYIRWEPLHTVHVDILDEQHRKLFDVVNDLIDENGMGSKHLLPVVHELVDLLAVHFEQERIVMTESSYPDYLEHSREHQLFADKIKEFFQEYTPGDMALEHKWITYLKEWVYTHTTRVDTRYGEHLLRNAEALKQSWE